MRRFLFLATILSLGAGCPRVRPIPKGVPARVAVLAPFSGAARGLAERVRRGVTLAASDAAPSPIELRFFDSRGDRAGGRAAVRDALAQGAIAAIGPVLSGEATAAAQAARDAGLPMLLLSGVRDATGGSVLRCFLEIGRQARAIAHHASRVLGLRRLIVLHPRTPYGRASAREFTRAAKAGRARVVSTIGYRPGLRRLRSVVQRLRKARFDGLFIADGQRTASLLAGYLAKARVALGRPSPGHRTVRLLGTNEWHSPALLRDSGNAVEGAILVAGHDPLATPASRAFAAAFLARFHEPAGYLEAFAYDAVMLLRHALAGGAGDTDALLAALRAMRLNGATGAIAFDNAGEQTTEPLLVEVREGRFTPLR